MIDDLYTGTNPTDTFGNEDEADVKVEAITEQQRALQELLPSVQYIRDICDDEIDAIRDIRSYAKVLGANPTAAKRDELFVEYRARELYIEFVNRLKDNIENMVANAEAEANR